MSKIIVSVTIVYSIIISSLFAKTNISLPTRNLTVSNQGIFTEFHGIQIYGAPGQPYLPVHTCAVLLPPDADLKTVTLSISGLKEKLLPGIFSVKPALPPQSIEGYCWPKDRNIVDQKDVAVYSTNAFFPANHIEVTSNGELFCYKIVQVQVYIARFNPVTNGLLQLQAGELVVDWKNDPSYNRTRSRSVKVPRSNTDRVKKMVVNYDQFAQAYENDFTFVQRGKLAIITTSSIKSGASTFDAFVACKQEQGFEVEVVLESDWGSDASSLRSWLQSNYSSMGLEYILLIGNSSDGVPMMTFTGYSRGNCPADWPYAQLTGDYKDDKTCELHVGRFPVYDNDMTTLDKIMQKTIEYTKAGDIAWRTNALFGAGGYDSGAKGDKLFEAMHKDITTQTPDWSDYRIYGTDYGTPTGTPDKTGISPTIFTDQWKSNQYGLVEWGTHGSSTSASHVFGSSYAAQVGNDYPAYVLCGSCSNATITTSNNLSYAILKDCGIGAIGGTNLTYYNSGLTSFKDHGSDQGWVYNFGYCMMKDKMTVGEALTYCREMHPSYGWYNRGPYVLYGDPTLSIYTGNLEPYVSVLSPNGGEEFEQMTTQTINWSDNIPGEVKIELLKGTTVVKELAPSTPSTGSFEWEITTNIVIDDNYKIRITSIDEPSLKSESKEAFSIVPEFIITQFPYVQDFDDMDTGLTRPLSEKWEQLDGDDFDWIVLSGPTPSNQHESTGPSQDHTTGLGNYVYVEASNPNNPQKKAEMITPKFNLKNSSFVRLTFWCHMWSDSNTMGDLYVDIEVDGMWVEGVIHLMDDHGDEWFEVTQYLDDFIGERVRFKFRGITGESWCGDMAIDDFMIDLGFPVTHTVKTLQSFRFNTFNGRIFFQIPEGMNKNTVSVSLYSMQGKLVRTLANGPAEPGYHAVSINPGNKAALAAGLYLCRMKTEGFTKTITVVLHK